MKPVGFTNKGGLTIEVTDPKPVYLPGQCIEGYVHLDANHGPYHTVILELFGQSHAETMLGSGIDRKFNSASAPVMKVPVTLTDGPIEASPSPRSWPFSLPVPATVHQLPAEPAEDRIQRSPCTDPFTAGEDYTQNDELSWPGSIYHKGYLSNKQDVSGEPIPSVFSFRKDYEELLLGQETRGEAYVEYFLRVTGRCVMGTVVRRLERPTSTYPVNIRNPAPYKPISDHKLASRAFFFQFKSSDLAPPSEDGDDSDEGGSSRGGGGGFRHRLARKIRSGTPRYSGRVFIEAPQVIQLDHPDPVPLKVWLMPILHADASYSSRAHCRPLILKWVRMSLLARHWLRAPSSFLGQIDVDQDLEYELLGAYSGEWSAGSWALRPVWKVPGYDESPEDEAEEFKPEGQSKHRGGGVHALPPHPESGGKRGILFPRLATPAVEDGCLDVGAALGMSVSAGGPVFSGDRAPTTRRLGRRWPKSQPRPGRLMPTTRTYNYRVQYTLRVELGLELVGKDHTVQMEQPVTVLAPSEMQMEAREEEGPKILAEVVGLENTLGSVGEQLGAKMGL